SATLPTLPRSASISLSSEMSDAHRLGSFRRGGRDGGGFVGRVRLALRQRFGQAGQGVLSRREAGLAQDLVDDRLERRPRQQLRRQPIAQSKAARAVHSGRAAIAAEHAAGVEDTNVGNLLDRLYGLRPPGRDGGYARP